MVLMLFSLGFIVSFAFLAYAVFSYLADERSHKQALSNADTQKNQTKTLVPPTVVSDPQTGTVKLTLSNGQQMTLSPVDIERLKRGVTPQQLNDEYMMRAS
jgi:hypothetical protein